MSPISKTDAYEAEVLKLTAGLATTIYTTTIIPPYASIYTATMSETGGGTEATGNGYTRIAVTFGAPTGTAPTQVANSAAFTFPVVVTAGYTAAAMGIHTASSAGSITRWQDITDVVLAVGDQLTCAIGGAVLTED